MYDVIIVGASVAGFVLAKRLDKKFRILMIDKRDIFKDEKVCGGLLSDDAQKVIGSLGVCLPKNVLVGPSIFSVRTIDLKTRLERYYQRFYVNMDRQAFDLFWASQIEDNVELNLKEYAKNIIELKDGTYILETNKKKYSSKIIVGADGVFSMVRKNILDSKKDTMQYYRTIQEVYEVEKAYPFYSVFFDSSITDYYAWTISKENKMYVGCAINGKQDVVMKFDKLKNEINQYGYKFENILEKKGSLIARPRKLSDLIFEKDGQYLIGEAAGAISPSSAEGISFAIKSAVCLAYALNNGDSYTKRMRPIVIHLVKKRLKSPFIFNPLIRKGIMLSGFDSMKLFK